MLQAIDFPIKNSCYLNLNLSVSCCVLILLICFPIRIKAATGLGPLQTLSFRMKGPMAAQACMDRKLLRGIWKLRMCLVRCPALLSNSEL